MLIGLYLICGLISKLMSFSGNPTEPSQVKRDRFPKLYKIVEWVFGVVVRIVPAHLKCIV